VTFRCRFLLAVLSAVFVGCGPTAEAIRPVPSGAPASRVPFRPPGTGANGAPQTPVAPSIPNGGPVAPSTDIPGVPPQSLPPGGEVWQPLTDFPVGEAFEVTAVTATTAGFVAVGFQAMPGEGPVGRSQGVVWQSADGRTWQPQIDPAFQFVTLEEVAAVGDSVFAFGSLETCDLINNECVEPSQAGWAIWRSIAGGAWERLEAPSSMLLGTMDRVVVAHGALIASGWSGQAGQSAIVWRSTDGTTWTETTDLAGMDPVDAVGEIPSGIVAFGGSFSGDVGDADLVAAASADGTSFAPVALPALSATTIQSLAAGPSGVVGVGDGDDIELGFNAVALFSTDGLTWTQADATDGSFAGTQLNAAHALPQGFVALGYTPDVDAGTTAGGSWISADGLAWRYLAPLGSGSFAVINASAAGPAGVIAFTKTDVGFDDESGTSEVDAWFAPIEALRP
jgi:hypothetical protein